MSHGRERNATTEDAMCGRLAMTDIPWADLAPLWMTPDELSDGDVVIRETIAAELAAAYTSPPRYNVAPTQDLLTVTSGRASGELGDPRDNHQVRPMRWGLIPRRAAKARAGARHFNARSESAHATAAFAQPIRQRRCLVLATGFYEWERVGKQSFPFLVSDPASELLTFAGVWDSWASPDGEFVESVAILTCEANDALSELHARMPVVLGEQARRAWLDPSTPLADARALMKTWPSERTTLRRVDVLVNDARVDSPDCQRAADLDALELARRAELEKLEDRSTQLGMFG
jgi:putative SOS response-associated peptidase YedK